MKWQEAERELRIWELRGCNCPNAHGLHSAYIPNRRQGIPGCAGLTRAAHNLMFSRMYEKNAGVLRAELAKI